MKNGQAASNGRTAPKQSAEDKWLAGKASHSKGSLRWADAGPEDVLAAIAAVTEDGAALLFSKTSDGGALSLHVLTGGQPVKFYPASMAELNETLMNIAEIANS